MALNLVLFIVVFFLFCRLAVSNEDSQMKTVYQDSCACLFFFGIIDNIRLSLKVQILAIQKIYYMNSLFLVKKMRYSGIDPCKIHTREPSKYFFPSPHISLGVLVLCCFFSLISVFFLSLHRFCFLGM